MLRLGYAAAATAALLWAAGATVAGNLFARGASPLELTAARAWIGLVGLALIVLARRKRHAARRAPPAASLAFGLAIAAVNFFYYSAIARLPVAIAIVIQYTAPGLVVLWLAIVRRERPSRVVVGALALAFVGVALISELPRLAGGQEITLDALGLVFAFASAVAFGAYMLVGEHLGRIVGADGALLRGFAVASLLWIAVIGARGRPDTLLDPSFAPAILFVSIGATIAPFLLFLWGIGRVGPARAGIVSTLEPVAAAVLAFAWLGQTLDAWQITGGIMVIAGIAVVQVERPREPEAIVGAAAIE